MKKRLLSILLCFCMVISLLPMSALAADVNASIGATALESGKYYTISDATVTALDNAPESGGYLYYTLDGTIGTLTVTGDVSYSGNIPALSITDCTLTLTGNGNLTMTSSGTPAVSGSSGSLTTSNFTGNLSFSSTGSNAITNCTDVTLETIGALTISGSSSDATIYCLNDVALKGSAVSLTNSYSGGSQLISAGGENVSVTATGGNLNLTGSTPYSPLVIADSGEQGKSGAVTLSASGNLSVVNSGNGMAVCGALTASAGGNITLESTGGMAVGGSLTVTDAANVTVSGGRNNAPAVSGAANITADGDISIDSAFSIDIGGTATLTAGGLVIRTTSAGSSVTADDDSIYPYGGDVGTSGLNISGKDASGNADSTYCAPTTTTLYKAGGGYIMFTPATTDPAANAKLELRDATISTTSGRALFLPAEPVDITVTGGNSLTANGSYNYAIDPNGQAVNIIGNGNLTLTGNKGLASWSGDTPGVTVDIGGDLVISTTNSYSISANGDIDISAASISTGIICASSSGSFAATAKTGNLTIDNSTSNSIAVVAGDITLEAPNGAISVNGKGNILLDASGMVTLNAQGNIALTGTNTSSTAIRFGSGVSITSNAGSIDVTTSGYNCMEKTPTGAVTLSAAKDITLNAANVAISASGQAVDITAGDKLSSTSAYGFQVGALTIKANEVSIAGTSQDGIQASSVTITNTDGTSNCESVSIVATSSSDSWAAIRALGSTDTGNITVKADDLFICGKGSAKAISALDTVTIGDAGMILGAISAGTDSIDSRIMRAAYGSDVSSSSLDLTTPPTETTVYTAGNGYALFTPATGTTPATLTLHNAEISTASSYALELSAETVIKLEGTNSLVNSTDWSVGIRAISTSSGECQPVTIQGSSGDSLTVSAWQCTRIGLLTVSGGSISMNGSVYGIFAEGNVILQNGAQVSATGGDLGSALHLQNGMSTTEQVDLSVEGGSSLTIDGSANITGILTVSGGSTMTLDDNSFSVISDINVTGSGSKLTVNSVSLLWVLGTINVEDGAVLENNGTVGMKLGTTVEQIKALHLSGTGVVRVTKTYDEHGYPETWDTYTNDGVALTEISGGLDLTSGDHSGATLENDGYTFNNNILTLGSTYISGGLTLPDNHPVVINTTENSVISGSINGAGSYHIDFTFTGSAPLTINGGISGFANDDTVTVQSGAQVIINGNIFLGASGGTDGTLNVSGSGTALSIASDSVYAVMCDTVNVRSGASLTTSAEGPGSRGVEALSGGVNVTGGSTLTAGCDYGVYISDGKLTVDSTSKLITNGSVAPFCVVDSTSAKTQSDALALAGVPAGTAIASVRGTDSGYGYTYWSLVPTAGNLNVSSENSSPVTLTGAVTGTLTFAKPASPADSTGSSGSSGGSVSYTLSFETNGGAIISNISKESGTTVDFVNFKPTREGYDFAGWYSDAALTEKVTSVKLTKNTTIYAKWTEKTVKIINPFTDVSESAYYHDAVLWAVQKSVTSGTSDTTFGPDMICTRAQMVTFLWRAMGSPEPASTDCLFTDVSQNAYYYKAVLWAVEKGITAGTSPTTFGADATVTRGQTVTFLWRAAGKPAASSANPFTDVSGDAYYYNAVLWAVEKDITHGTSATTFSPANHCTRGQVVTFLYHYIGE